MARGRDSSRWLFTYTILAAHRLRVSILFASSIKMFSRFFFSFFVSYIQQIHQDSDKRALLDLCLFYQRADQF